MMASVAETCRVYVYIYIYIYTILQTMPITAMWTVLLSFQEKGAQDKRTCFRTMLLIGMKLQSQKWVK